MNYVKLGKEVSFALRHHPERYCLDMDEQGWVDLNQLLDALKDKYGELNENDIIDLMKCSDKQRYELKDHRIRAYYGHSFEVKIKKEIQCPPTILYHGTAQRFIDSIMEKGLQPMDRQYVHLSIDDKTAWQVGRRHDSHPIILEIHAYEAYKDGLKFYLGNDNVWLSDVIPTKYLYIKNG